MVNLLCMVKDVSYSEEDVTFILTSTIGNNLPSKKTKQNQIGFISTYYLTSLFHVCTTLVVPAMFKVKVDSQRAI